MGFKKSDSVLAVKHEPKAHTHFLRHFFNSENLVKYSSELDFKHPNRVLAVKHEPKIHRHLFDAIL